MNTKWNIPSLLLLLSSYTTVFAYPNPLKLELTSSSAMNGQILTYQSPGCGASCADQILPLTEFDQFVDRVEDTYQEINDIGSPAQEAMPEDASQPTEATSDELVQVSRPTEASSAIESSPVEHLQSEIHESQPLGSEEGGQQALSTGSNDRLAETLTRIDAAIASISKVREDQRGYIDEGLRHLELSSGGAVAELTHGVTCAVKKGIAPAQPQNGMLNLLNDSRDNVDFMIKSALAYNASERDAAQIEGLATASDYAPINITSDVIDVGKNVSDGDHLTTPGAVGKLFGDASGIDEVSSAGGTAKGMGEARHGYEHLSCIPAQIREMHESGERAMAFTDHTLQQLRELKESLIQQPSSPEPSNARF